MSKHKFKIGDKVRVIESKFIHTSGHRYDIGEEVTIVECLGNKDLYYDTRGKHQQWMIYEHELELVTNDNPFIQQDVQQKVETVQQIKECSCSSRELFNLGCKCGAVKPYDVNQFWRR